MNIKDIIKALNDESRLKMVFILSNNKYCQVHVSEIINISQCNVSRNLNMLHKSGIISYERTDKKNRYFVTESFKSEHSELYKKIIQEYAGSDFDKHYLTVVENDCKTMNTLKGAL